jgi:hypothetical protein
MTCKIKTGLLATVFVAGAAAAPALTIDTFDAEQSVGSATTSTPDGANSVSGASILGGTRDMTATSDVTRAFPATTGIVTGSVLDFSNDVGSTGSVTVVYDGDSDPTTLDTAGLGGVDFTDGGVATAFAFDILSVDLPGLEFHLTVYDTGSGVSSLVATLPSAIPAASPERVRLEFADFTGTADFTDVGAFKFTLTGTAAIDATIDLVGTVPPAVPVPAALPLMLAGIGGMAMLGRRKRAA